MNIKSRTVNFTSKMESQGFYIKRSESTTVQTNLKLRNIDTDSSPVERLLTGYQHYINNLAYSTWKALWFHKFYPMVVMHWGWYPIRFPCPADFKVLILAPLPTYWTWGPLRWHFVVILIIVPEIALNILHIYVHVLILKSKYFVYKKKWTLFTVHAIFYWNCPKNIHIYTLIPSTIKQTSTYWS